MPAPKQITPDEWARIVAVFARHEGRVMASANELGWSSKRAQRVLDRGYPSIGYPPVRTLLARDAASAEEVRAARHHIEAESGEDEQARREVVKAAERVGAGEEAGELSGEAGLEEARRVAALVKREQEREAARADAVKARAEEASLVSASRRNALALNAVTAQVLRGAVRLAAKVQQALEEEAGSGSKLSVGAQLALLRQTAQIARFNAEAGLQAVKSERMALGQSLDPLEGDDEKVDSLEDATKWIDATTRALEKARARGLLAFAVVTPGIQPTAQQAAKSVTPGIQANASPKDVTPGIHPKRSVDREPIDTEGEEVPEDAEQDEDKRPTDKVPPPAPMTREIREALEAGRRDRKAQDHSGRAPIPTAAEERAHARARSRSRGRMTLVHGTHGTSDAE